MKIAAVNFRRWDTQVAIGNYNEQTDMVEVEKVWRDKSLTAAIAGHNSRHQLEDFFKKLKLSDKKIKNIYATLPPNMSQLDFKQTEHVKSNISKAVIKNWCANIIDIPEDLLLAEYYFDAPLIIKNSVGTYNISVAATRKQYVDTIFDAADNSRADLVSIEPSSTATVRFLTNPLRRAVKPYFLLETERYMMTITGYDPKQGLFTLQFPEMGWNTLCNADDEVQERVLTKYILMIDQTAMELFGCGLMDMYILPEKDVEIKNIIEKFMSDERILQCTLENVMIKNLSEDVVDDIGNYATLLGALLKRVHEKEGGQ